MNPLIESGRQSLPTAFRTAIAGIRDFSRERNSRIEIAAGIIAIVLAAVLRLPAVSWAILLLTIFGVLSLEAVNCAIERVVDLASPGYHELARQAKDIAAGAVLIAAIGSVGIGLILFLPRIIAISGSLSP